MTTSARPFTASLEDGRLRLDNNLSEQQLRNVILGCHNWTFFANETGLRWYTTFRSLIASCALHDLNPQVYIEQLLRLAPHWSKGTDDRACSQVLATYD